MQCDARPFFQAKKSTKFKKFSKPFKNSKKLKTCNKNEKKEKIIARC